MILTWGESKRIPQYPAQAEKRISCAILTRLKRAVRLILLITVYYGNPNRTGVQVNYESFETFEYGRVRGRQIVQNSYGQLIALFPFRKYNVASRKQ